MNFTTILHQEIAGQLKVLHKVTVRTNDKYVFYKKTTLYRNKILSHQISLLDLI